MIKKDSFSRPVTPILGKFHFLLLVIVVAAVLFPDMNRAEESTNRTSRQGDSCLGCHSNVWQAVLANTYIHKPFLEKKCVLCHIEALDQRARSKDDSSLTEWFFRSTALQSEYYLKLPKNYTGGDLVIQLAEMSKGRNQQTIKGRRPELFARQPQDQEPPVISNLRVSSIEQGLFLTAMVEWETNEPSDAQVFYGIEKMNLPSVLLSRPTRHHRVQLSKLKKNRSYNFQAVSTDLSHNTKRSEIQQFSTYQTIRQSPPMPAEKKALSFSHHFFQLQEALWLAIESSRPTRLNVGLVVPPKTTEIKQATESDEAPDRHQLKSVLETNNDVCTPCHGEYMRKGNHPINVSAPEGMHIPSDYLVLPNGNIICMTCHTPHGSNYDFRLVKSSKQELCLGCHHEKE